MANNAESFNSLNDFKDKVISQVGLSNVITGPADILSLPYGQYALKGNPNNWGSPATDQNSWFNYFKIEGIKTSDGSEIKKATFIDAFHLKKVNWYSNNAGWVGWKALATTDDVNSAVNQINSNIANVKNQVNTIVNNFNDSNARTLKQKGYLNGVDVNNINETGIYTWNAPSSPVVNLPNGVSGWGTLIVVHDEVDRRLQIAYSLYGDWKIHFRQNNNDWQTFATSDDISNVQSLANQAQQAANNAQNTANSALSLEGVIGSGAISQFTNVGIYALTGGNYTDAPSQFNGNGQLVVLNVGFITQTIYARDASVYNRTIVNGVVGNWRQLG